MDAETSVVLYVQRTNACAFPMNTRALRIAQGSEKEIMRNKGAFLISRTGRAQEILDIKISGYYGSTWTRRLLSAFTGAYSIDVTLERAKIELSEIKGMVVRALEVDRAKSEPIFDKVVDFDNAIALVLQADGIEKIFDALRISDADEVLDVMC